MPLYDYRCPEHGVFEALAGFGQNKDPQPCPKCDSPSERTGVTMPAFVRPNGEFKMQAITTKGEYVNGSFGKTAPNHSKPGYKRVEVK